MPDILEISKGGDRRSIGCSEEVARFVSRNLSLFPESRIQAINAAKRLPRILWDIPGPDYEPSAEEVYARGQQRDQLLYERDSESMVNSARRKQE